MVGNFSLEKGFLEMGIPRNGGLAMQNMFYSSFNHALNGGSKFFRGGVD